MKYDHLSLKFVPNDAKTKKRTSGGGGYKPVIDRDKKSFFNVEIQKFKNMQKEQEKMKRAFCSFIDPKLIFKVKINQSVTEDRIEDIFKGMDIEILSPSPDRLGYWVVFSNDSELKKFQKRFEDYKNGTHKYDFFEAFDEFVEIPPQEKIAKALTLNPLKEGENANLDFEIWRMQDKDLYTFLNGLEKFIVARKSNENIIDKYITKNTCVYRIKVDKELFEEIIKLREIASVDRPFLLKIEQQISVSLEQITKNTVPNEKASGILIVDSGILPNHPLLQNCVGQSIAIPTIKTDKIKEDQPYDDVGHGTKVAGTALYGDIENCIDNRAFIPEIWIFSSKIMYPDDVFTDCAVFDPDELYENQLDHAIKRIVEHYPNCRIVNLSLGNASVILKPQQRQLRLACCIDELIKKYNIIAVISTGNSECYNFEKYPDYFYEGNREDVKIIDPATSALGLTVGALAKISERRGLSQTFFLYPSTATRVGLGLGNMLKPELVEIGGGFMDKEIKDVVINPNWINEGRLFTLASGTSFSAPKISHDLAKIMNKYPSYSLNLVKALLINSANIPDERPRPFDEINWNSNNEKLIDLLKVYGYGKPNLEQALYSEDDRVVLLRDNQIRLNQIHVYEISLPKDFFKSRGIKKISVTLVYDPEIRRNRLDYLGVGMEFHLFKDTPIGKIYEMYSEISTSDEESISEEKPNEIDLKPGVDLRKKGVHQKGLRIYQRIINFNPDIPLILVVICKNRWIDESQIETYLQNYAIVVSVENKNCSDLYNQVQLKNLVRATITDKV